MCNLKNKIKVQKKNRNKLRYREQITGHQKGGGWGMDEKCERD